MSTYKEFSYYYDKLMYDCDYDKWSQYLISEVIGRGVDFACGSGKLTIPLKKAGFDVVGVDISSDMLKVAAENARESGVKVDFILSDMTKFRSPKKLNFATCILDGTNYLNKSSVQKFFQNVYDNLETDGKFIFDISSKYKLLEVIGENFFYDDEEEVTYLWTNKVPKNKEYVQYNIAFFVKEKEHYNRFDEVHKLYVYEVNEIIELLQQVGFRKIEVLDEHFYKKPNNKALRNIFNVTK